jgi:hypothetical protein
MRQILTSITLLFLATTLFSQGHNEQVTVIAPYQPTLLSEAFKINVIPQTIDSVLVPREARFDIFSRKVATTFGTENIRPARVAGEPLPKLSPLYVRGGTDFYRTTYGELFYASLRSEQWQYGAHLKHRAYQGTFKNHEVPFTNSENLVNLFGDYFGKKVLLSADFYYDRKRFSRYGADTSFLRNSIFLDQNWERKDFIKDELYKIIYQNIGGNIGFSDNNTEPNSLGYSGNLNINAFQPNTASRADENELSIYFTGNIHRTFDFRHPIFNQTIVGIDVASDWHRNNGQKEFTFLDGSGFQLNDFHKMLRFHPYGKLRFSGHDFSLGLRINTFDELNGGKPEDYKVRTEVQFVPTVRAKFNLIDNLFAIEFGMDGNVEYATQKNTAKLNPFAYMWSLPALSNPQLHREYYLGLNTALSKTIDFSMKGRLVSYKNLLNFESVYFYPFSYFCAIDDRWLPIRSPFFDPFYEDEISCFQIQADLNYHLDEKISISAMARWNNYDEPVIYRPEWESNLTARYNIQDKIILKTQLYFEAGRYYDISEGNSKKFNPFVDWSIGAEYRFNKRWSAFAEINNILNQKYYQWYGYRSFGCNFLVGATFNL